MRDTHTEFKELFQSVHLVDFRFHDFRSTWAAGAALDGVQMEQIREALGHSTVRVTEQHYAQTHPDYREKAREYAKRAYASNVAFVRCNDAFFITDLTFNFTLTCRSSTLAGNHYSDYQLFLYQTISERREQGTTFDAIAEWLNKEGYLTVRGKKFRGTHVHSILKKRLAKEELLKLEYPPVWSDFSMEVVDKTILMSDFGFLKMKK